MFYSLYVRQRGRVFTNNIYPIDYEYTYNYRYALVRKKDN